MNLIQSGLTWLHAQRTAHTVVDVTYQRAGSLTIQTGKATPGRFGGDTLLEGETEINSNARDFLFDPAFFTNAGTFNEPQPGDRITIVDTGEICEVSAEGADNVWRWSDPHQTAVRVHSHTVKR